MTDKTHAYEFLLSLPRYDKRGAAALKPGFERIESLLSAMGNPETSYPSVLVAGTNGKGSTASMLAAVATAHGQRVGLHTSPHIHDVTERIRLDGTPADAGWFAETVLRYKSDIERTQPSFFEATVALSLKYFADREVDLAVVEVGLGGRLDATNILSPIACAISRIGYDHMDFLGDTLPEIAKEKAGILKAGVPAWTSNDDMVVLHTLRDHAETMGTTIRPISEVYPWFGLVPGLDGTVVDTRSGKNRFAGLHVGLRGRHQAENALLALAVAEHVLGRKFDVSNARRGLADVERLSGLQGRLQIVERNPLIVADAAHNPSGIQSALAWLTDVVPRTPQISVALGLMRDKALGEIEALLAPRLKRLYPIQLDSERGLDADELAARFGRHVEIRQVGGLSAAIDDFRDYAGKASASEKPVLLIAGSHYLLAQLPSH